MAKRSPNNKASYHDYDDQRRPQGGASRKRGTQTGQHRQGAHSQPRGSSYKSYEEGMKVRDRQGRNLRVAVTFLTILLLAVVGTGGWWLWNHRDVTITVDGQEVTMRVGTSMQDLYELFQPEAEPGNLVSVGGNLLEEGAGDPVGVTVNGAAVAYADFPATTVSGGETIEFTHGADLTEDYSTEIEETQPKLAFDVDDDVAEGDTGYQAGLVEYVEQWGLPGRVEWRTGAISGERVQGDTLQEVQDCVVRFCYVHPDDGRLLVALTFDDGPTSYTPEYLSILEEYDVNATFMMIGEQVGDFGDTLARSVSDGNQLGSHTWSHINLAAADAETELTELRDTVDVIEQSADVTTGLLRPPYGNMTRQAWLQSGGLVNCTVIWTHDSEDWQTPGVDAIVANCTTYFDTGSVLLMHDGGGDRDQDLEALPLVISAWKNAGYEFVTVEDLLASDSSIHLEPMPEGAVWPAEYAE